MTAALIEPGRIVGDLSLDEFRALIRGAGLPVRIGPFDARIRVVVEALNEPLYRLYRDYPLLDHNRVFNFHVDLRERRRYGLVGDRMVRFTVDGRAPHEDMPAPQALAVLEWGINLVIALRAHRYVMLHSAVLERDGRALVMPASPGDGKTTLCTGLAHRGWRLLSDEFGLICPRSREVVPIPRPMALKNESIDVIRAFAPDAELGPVIPETRKGTIAHVKPPRDSVLKANRRAAVSWIVFPRWIRDAHLSLQEVPRADGFMVLASNAFNYELRGEHGFEALRSAIDNARCFDLIYSDLRHAVAALDEFADGRFD
ncbi:MAG: HprK-related kinase A [Gammaproteobacteria bacterium]